MILFLVVQLQQKHLEKIIKKFIKEILGLLILYLGGMEQHMVELILKMN